MEPKIESKKHGVYSAKPAEKPVVEPKSETVTLKPSTVSIRLIYDSKMRRESPTTGKSYDWNKIGDVVSVDTEDVQYLLDIRLGGRGCCGGLNEEGNKIFEIA